MNNAAAAITPETTLGEVMTTDLAMLNADDNLRVVDELMTRRGLRHFPVLDGNRLAGVICQADLLCSSVVLLSRGDSPREALSKILVRDVMKPAETAPPETSIYEAARRMVEAAVKCLIVVENKEILGIVSRTDLLRALARN
jgi:CBS domain-containing protein